MSLVHPLAHVMGRGSAKSGVHHWWVQRLTALALVPLTVWVVFAVTGAADGGYTEIRAWLADPLNASLMVAWTVTMLYHAQLGLQVVIEDYVYTPWLEISCQVAVKFGAALGIILSVLSILRVVIGGSQ